MSELKIIRGRGDVAARELDKELVLVPEWGPGAAVYVRTLSAIEKEKYIASIRQEVGRGRKKDVKVLLEQSSAKLLIRTVCDESGAPIFTEHDIEWLGQQDTRAIDRIQKVAARLNGLDDDAEEEAKNASASATATGDSSIA